MRFIPTWLHGIADYLMGIILIAAPWALGFAGLNAATTGVAGAETWVPVFLGFGVIIYSLFTRYELGLFPAISMSTHLWLDALSGAFLAASPWIFGFSGFVYLPHLILGVAEMLAAACTETLPGAYVPEVYETGADIGMGTRRGTASTMRTSELGMGGMGSPDVSDVTRPQADSNMDRRREDTRPL